MINNTKDYSIFKNHNCNRELVSDNLNKIKNSILFKNMLHLRPIIVNSSMEVIDGKHRLEAAKILDLPIYYVIEKDSEDEDIILLNANQKKWEINDYLNYYCKKGEEEYIKFKKFLDKNDIKHVTSGLIILGQQGTYFLDLFKTKKFKIPKDLSEYNNKCMCIKNIQHKLNLIMTGTRRNFYKSARFMRAIIIFSNSEDFDFNIFLKKIEMRLEAFYPCFTIEGYLEMFKNIYNYRNPHPIQLAPLDK